MHISPAHRPARPAQRHRSRDGTRTCAAVRLLGHDVEVPCADGRRRRYVNLDYAASTSPLPEVWRAVEGFMPWYSGVHRGSGIKSRVATEAFESTRDVVAGFVRAPAEHDVVFVRNTTEAINLLAAALPERTPVLGAPGEHHANMLPWRRHDLRLLPFTTSTDALCAACDDALRTARPRIALVAVTGASNVTGEVAPLRRLAEVAHRHGARLFVDAAQLAPHRAIDMEAMGIDFLALSGHKLYAPFGAGALIGPMRGLGLQAPLLRGGGAIKLVTLDEVVWADAPERHEAGSPNVVGVVALGAACAALGTLGMDAVAEHERMLAARLRRGLATVPGLRQLASWPEGDAPRVGVASFTMREHRHPLVAAVLSAEHAIGVRSGCFCAHPLVTRLLGIPAAEVRRLRTELRAGGTPQLPGAVRASLGLGTTPEDVDRLVEALMRLAVDGPRAAYRHVAARDEYEPVVPDDAYGRTILPSTLGATGEFAAMYSIARSSRASPGCSTSVPPASAV